MITAGRQQIVEEARAFLARLDEVSRHLEGFSQGMEQREEKVLTTFETLKARLSKPVPRNGGFEELVAPSLVALTSGLDDWSGHVQTLIRGREFINQFERSIIVLVFGKVNSGKSTLGNFVAGLGFSGLSDNPYQGRKPQFRVHDTADHVTTIDRLEEVDSDQGFQTKATECTASIQEFTLGGLSWIDSPGIHATTETNEQLAKRYSDNAELIIYLTSADAAARHSDRKELSVLAAKGKPVLIVISKFDNVEEDLDENDELIKRIVERPASSKAAIQGWIEQQVRDAGVEESLRNRQYCFVSSRLAKLALEQGDADLFERSGMPDLYRQLTRVLSDEAVELKSRAPRERFNALMKDILQGGENTGTGRSVPSVDELGAKLQATRVQLKDKRAQLTQKGPEIARRVRYKAAPVVEALLVAEAQRVEETGQGSHDLREQIGAALQGILREVMVDEITTVLRDFEIGMAQTLDNLSSWDIPAIEQKYESIEVSERVLYTGAGKALGGAGGAMIGGFIGNLIFPGVGGIVGGFIGGAAGQHLGGEAGGAFAGTKTLSIKAGTNIQQVVETLFTELENRLPQDVAKQLENVAKGYFDPLDRLALEIIGELDQTKRRLQELMFI